MRRMGLDLGAVRTGVAVSDELGRLAFAREGFLRRSLAADLETLRRLLEREQAGELVVGLPLRPDGRDSDRSAEVRRFAAAVGTALSVPIRYQDERHSSAEAEEALAAAGVRARARRARSDSEAARIILQRYLDGLSEAER